jgi:hypothetical protein
LREGWEDPGAWSFSYAKPRRVQTTVVVSTILVQTTLVVSSRVEVSERERDHAADKP